MRVLHVTIDVRPIRAGRLQGQVAFHLEPDTRRNNYRGRPVPELVQDLRDRNPRARWILWHGENMMEELRLDHVEAFREWGFKQAAIVDGTVEISRYLFDWTILIPSPNRSIPLCKHLIDGCDEIQIPTTENSVPLIPRIETRFRYLVPTPVEARLGARDRAIQNARDHVMRDPSLILSVPIE